MLDSKPQSVLAALVRSWRRRWQMRKIAASGAFDSRWYLRRYPDVAAAKCDPLRHFFDFGHVDGRFPNPIFDTDWYLSEYLHGDTRINTLIDYLNHGQRRGHRPNRWFDPVWYRKMAGIGPAVDPMAHYLAVGGNEISPQPRPDLAAVARAYPDFGGDGTALGFVLNSHRVFGIFDACTSYYVAAWTARRVGPGIVITIVVNGQTIGEVKPWIDRPDVKRALGHPGHGFYFAFPTRLRHGDRVELHDGFGQSLIGCSTAYEVPPLDSTIDLYKNRAAIASTFLQGRGVEIGAYTQPTDLPPDRDVAFYDRYTADELLGFYEPDCGRPMMMPDYVGDAEKLDGLPDAAFDFVIANHVIEHLQDPIRFLMNVASKLVSGGRAMIAVPDKRYCGDEARSLTPFAHLVDDHELGTEPRQRAHFVQFFMEFGHDEAAAQAKTDATDMNDWRFHYHVWDAETFGAFIDAAIARYDLPLARIHWRATTMEIIVLLEKTLIPKSVGYA